MENYNFRTVVSAFIIFCVPSFSVKGENLKFVPGFGAPNSHFRVVWNSPTVKCNRFGVDIDLQKYGIEVNGFDGWRGDKITIYYRDELGLYPFIDKSTGKVVNGGVPQAVDINAHLKKVAADIHVTIPDSDFDGLGVIDWEPWRPLWERNWDSKKIYQDLSEEIVRKQHPDWNDTQIETEAQRQFSTAARQVIEKTVEYCRYLRPHGYWGYYEFPECYNYQGTRTCDNKTRAENDELQWLFAASSSLFPSGYLGSPKWNLTHKADFIHGQIQEGLRVDARFPEKPVYLYTRYQYVPFYPFYSKDDFDVTIKQAADFGISGVVQWGDNYSSHNRSICLYMKNYVDTILGPTVADILNRTRTCEQEYCQSRGRCVLRKWLSSSQWLEFEMLHIQMYAGFVQSYVQRTELLDFYAKHYVCVT